MTTYYTVSGTPPAQTRGSSAAVRTEFVSIQTAFSAVNGEMVLKAPLASPALTGTPTAPTAAAGTNTTQLATTAFVAAAGLNASLPGQLGKSGKVITTDGTSASWGVQSLPRSARTANTILSAADKATLIDATANTWTQTFTACATMGDGWWCYIRNSGTGDITLDPNAAETIDGLTSFIMYPGEARLIQCDGIVLRTIVLHPYYRAITSTLVFTTPPGYSYHGGIAWSAGASGQRTNNANSTSIGGGGGGAFPFTLTAAELGATPTITIAAGGLAVSGAANGNDGGNTTVGTALTVFGGAGGKTTTPGGTGGSVGYAAAMIAPGGQSAVGFEAAGPSGNATLDHSVWGGSTANYAASSASGNSVYGGTAGGCAAATAGGLTAVGASLHGGVGGAASYAGNGVDGTAPGGGGGATQTGTQSGAGARGEVRIWGIV